MHDFLLENSIMYKELIKEGELKGLERGRVQGVEQGREAGIRQSILTVVQTRFPTLLDLARARVGGIQNQDQLQKLLVAMVAADTERKAQRYLLALNEKQ